MPKSTKSFLKKNWSLILVLIYFIAPDLIPGFFDDAALILVERVVHSYMSNKEKAKDNNEKEDVNKS
ncbi:MAG: DUF1232 domain-containing protein [Mariniphaga sp.]|nr:DUF1232 domain-containing protein [Mariniphaga sp.]